MLEDWRVEEKSLATVESEQNYLTANKKKTKPIIEANSWMFDEQGKVVLVANQEIGASNNSSRDAKGCQANYQN